MAGRFFTEALNQAVAPLLGTEAIPFDVPTGGSGFLNPRQLAGFVPQVQYSADGATADFTASVGELAGSGLCVLDLTGALTADAAVTTPTGADLEAGLIGGGFVGQSWVLRTINNSSAAHIWTLTGGSGVTIAGTATIAQNTWREWVCMVTGAGAVTMQNAGSGTN